MNRSPTVGSIPGGGAGHSIITTRNIWKSFGPVEALKDVSFAVRPGEIRGVCGENGAGKSTLIKILTGVYRADRGTVLVDGEATDIRRPQQAQELGIALVAQELSLTLHQTIEDNIWLGNRTVPLFHRRRVFRDRAVRALETVGLGSLDLDTPVAALSIGQRQLVEVARLLTRNARVLILDEPTAALSDVEIEKIFAALRALKQEGRSIIYITHRLGEVFEICDTVTVMRNGEVVATHHVERIDRDRLIELMLGRPMGEMYPDSSSRSGGPLMVVEGLRIPGVVEDFHLVAPRGQIVCIAGQIGSGAAEAVRAIAGVVPEATGRVVVSGRPLQLNSVPQALASNVMFISEDRAGEGIFLHMSVLDNLVATRLGEYSRGGLLSWPALRFAAARLAGRVGVSRTRLRARAEELSGGNQQKLAFARSLERKEPGVLLMNEPTRGVDVGARSEIYRLMQEFCDLGYALVMTSSDLEEVMGLSDVIVTMYRGRQVARYERGQATIHRVLSDITHPTVEAVA